MSCSPRRDSDCHIKCLRSCNEDLDYNQVEGKEEVEPEALQGFVTEKYVKETRRKVKRNGRRIPE